MASKKSTLEKLWLQQHISDCDIDYNIWSQKRELIKQMSRISHSCLFTVDVYKGTYDFASESFSDIFGYNRTWIKNIENEGDLLEDRIHPADRDKMLDIQIKHSQFIYSRPVDRRNDYKNTYQFRVLNANGKYINVTSNQRVIQTDKNGKAWIVMGIMDISHDQTSSDVKYSACNIKTGEIVTNKILFGNDISLTQREIEILQMISNGLLTKEIANKLHLSIHTVNNHRKNILKKIEVDNSIEAINYAKNTGLIY